MEYQKPRIIITTDLECDGMNSLIHLCLYLNEIELEASSILPPSSTGTGTGCTRCRR